MTPRQRLQVWCSLLFLLLPTMTLAGNDWLPLSDADLKATAPAEASGADAIILLHQADYDDQQSVATHYYRVKILNDAGKKWADVEIPFVKGSRDIREIKARTIHPDGTIVPFDGKVYEKTVVKVNRGNLRVNVKAFTLPNVTAGSIIEYRYREEWGNVYYAPDWLLQDDLFTKTAHFSMKGAEGRSLAWIWAGLPNGIVPQRKGDLVVLDVNNMPAFDEEEYSPPEHELKSRVEFYYIFDNSLDPKKIDEFWKRFGKERNSGTEDFIGHRGLIASLASETVAANDSPETKLRKLYERTQQIENISFEREKSEQELKRENRKENQNVEDVVKHGYGSLDEITLTFIALARAAGFDAQVVLIPDRYYRFFHETVPNTYQFTSMVAAVKLPQGTVLIDPGTPYCPFGMLAWYKTGVRAMELDKNGGAFITTNNPRAEQSIRQRIADLTMDDEGVLKGTLTVNYIGQLALDHRLDLIDTDDAGWRKDFEDTVKQWLPQGAKATLDRIDGKTQTDEVLRVQFHVEMPGVLSSTGKRVFLPADIFQEEHPFRQADRKYPVYLSYPYEYRDSITIHLPADLQVDSLPPGHELAPGFASYSAARTSDGHVLTLQRNLVVSGFFYPLKAYNDLRSFFDAVSNADGEQVVAKHAQPSGL